MSVAEEVLKSLQGQENTTPSKTNFKGGIFKAKDFAGVMIKSFMNGKSRGETTHFRTIDPHFTWKKGFLYAFTGYPNHGKTEVLLQLALTKSVHAGWIWGIFCPENMGSDDEGNVTPEEIFDTLIHSYIGKSTDPHYKHNQMSLEEYQRGIEFVDKHFIVIYPKEDKTPELVMEYFSYIVKLYGLNGCIIDPWNKLIHAYSGLLDEYLASKFARIKDFSIRNCVVFCFVEHPKGNVHKNADGSLPIPDGYSLRGGAMWLNAMDVIVAAYRPNYHVDKSDQQTDLIVHKVKNQKLVGIPGTINLTFDRKTNRYYESDGNSPLHVIPIQNNDVFKSATIEDFNKAPF